MGAIAVVERGSRLAFSFADLMRPRAPERGRTLERLVFRLGYRGRSVTLAVRDGFVTDEFIDLAGGRAAAPRRRSASTA